MYVSATQKCLICYMQKAALKKTNNSKIATFTTTSSGLEAGVFCGRVRSNEETGQTNGGGTSPKGDAGTCFPGKF